MGRVGKLSLLMVQWKARVHPKVTPQVNLVLMRQQRVQQKVLQKGLQKVKQQVTHQRREQQRTGWRPQRQLM